MSNLFERDFYPTPKEVISRMMQGEDVVGKVILEPSAGSGNIVEWLKEAGAKEVIACEINEDLQKIVGKKCRLVGDDFLKLRAEEVSHIDMIVMNPPFSQDVRHILHAYEIAPAGCRIISLCNSQTISNAFSTERKKLKEIIEYNGYDEYLGECFKAADRTTGVGVSLIKLYKTGQGEEEFSDYLLTEEDEDKLQEGAPGLMPYNVIRDIVNRYVMAISKYDSVMNAANEINSLTSLIGGSQIKFGAYRSDRSNYSDISRGVFKKQLQKESWNFIFRKLDISRYVTSGVREQINKFVEQQVNVPFTMRNVYRMLDLIVQTHGQRMNRALEEAFDMICSFSSDNSTAGEKWKTNSNYMINKKFIVPGICEYDPRWPKCHVHKSVGRNVERMNDVDSALSYMAGVPAKSYDEKLSYAFFDHIRLLWGEWGTWGFFRIKGFKKGTMHFEFLDEKVWEEFNRKVAKIKGWKLPDKSKIQRKK